MFKDHSKEEIDVIMQEAWNAFQLYKNVSFKERAAFMRNTAVAINESADVLIRTAAVETHLPKSRLMSEINRTIFQLNSYADHCERGEWLNVRIDTADKTRNPPKPDLRKTMTGLGPVIVFGASNFPFAYSTAGGDTASAFAAGCPVIVKAHPGHAKTSELVAEIISKTVIACNLPNGVFAHVHGASFETGEQLVKHPLTKAVGFTGSLSGGRQLFDWGNQRTEPIPVFAEMGSINPVFLLPERLRDYKDDIAEQLADSITLNVGQFCTNPGILIGLAGNDLDEFTEILLERIRTVDAAPMLNVNIYKSYHEKRTTALSQENVRVLYDYAIKDVPILQSVRTDDNAQTQQEELITGATLVRTTAADFVNNKLMQQEVFGPYSMIVACENANEMMLVCQNLAGQLTCTIMAKENEICEHTFLIDCIRNICGRVILNAVPTGVEVCLAMHHGGPYPASTDSRFTAVGGDAIKRFARPVSFQNWPDNMLPPELKDENPLNILRTINNFSTKEKIH